MKMDVNVNFSKIGLDDNTNKLLTEFNEVQKLGSKKLHRIEIDEYTKGVANGVIALGILGILSMTAYNICKVIWGK